MNKYLIAILCCGIETDGDEYYNFPELIEAENEKEALEKYNQKVGDQYYRPVILSEFKYGKSLPGFCYHSMHKN